LSRAACAARRASSVRSAFASELPLSSLRDSAESDWCASKAGAFVSERLPKDPKLPFDDDFDEDDEEERCDENPLLKDEEPVGLASAGAAASDSIRDSANAACANFEWVFSMVRSAGES
jgi:hypothetical protein